MTQLFTNPYLAVLALIIGFGFLIFVHELGHFLVAKWVGIRATQFAIGFGHALLSWRKGVGFRIGSTEKEYFDQASKHLRQRGAPAHPHGDTTVNKIDVVDVEEPTHDKQYTEAQLYAAADELGLGETEYRLNWMPLGGYVKMLGQEDMDPAAMSDDPRAFNRKSIGARAAVISAGVVMNIIFGMLFLIIAFSDFAGVEFAAPYVGATVEGSPAATTYAQGHEDDPAYLGLRPGDHITHVHGKPIEDLVAVRIAGALGDPGVPVPLTIQRDGEAAALTYNVTAVPDEVRSEGMLAMGIQPAMTLTLSKDVSQKDWADTIWARAGVSPGMTLSAVDGVAIDQAAALRRGVNEAQGQPVTLTFANAADGGDVNIEVQPLAALPAGEEGSGALLGLLPATTVSQVVKGSPAAEIKIQPGDVLARVGDAVYPTVDEVIDAVQSAGRDPITVEVLRGAELVSLKPVTPDGGRLGIGLTPGVDAGVIRGVEPGGALSDLNLPPGSRLTGEIETFNALLAHLQTLQTDDAEGEAPTLTLTFAINLGPDGDQTETVTVPLDSETLAVATAAEWSLPAALPFEPLEVRVAGETLGEAASIGLTKTGEFVQQTYITLLRLFQGSVKTKHLRGPVGIVDAGATVAARGWPYYLFFLGLISVNLAVINFLPIPIVDGGLMVFLLIEKLRGKPASPAVQTAAMIVGLVLIAGVFLIVTYNDIIRIFTRMG